MGDNEEIDDIWKLNGISLNLEQEVVNTPSRLTIASILSLESQLGRSPMHFLDEMDIRDYFSDEDGVLDWGRVREKENQKRHMSAVFIGHVDAGKSTIVAQILLLTGQVDDRTIQIYEKEAKDKKIESWYMNYILARNDRERLVGKPVEFGTSHLETETTRFTILDALGDKGYVPGWIRGEVRLLRKRMISGKLHADIGVLVISARKGEFETGYNRDLETREHLQLAKTLGVIKLLIVVNKMDDPTVNWSKQRYDEIESSMTAVLNAFGYNATKDVQFLPISGVSGDNIKTAVNRSACSWWNGQCLFEALDSVEVPYPDPTGPFRMPIDTYNDNDTGAHFTGKIYSGSVSKGDILVILPPEVMMTVGAMYDSDENVLEYAGAGEHVTVTMAEDMYKGESLQSGFVLSSIGNEDEKIRSRFLTSSFAGRIISCSEFTAQLEILAPETVVLSAGYRATLLIHSVVKECEIGLLMTEMSPMKRKQMNKNFLCVRKGDIVNCRIETKEMICIEKFSDFPELGKLTLINNYGKTVAIGEVTEIFSVY